MKDEDNNYENDYNQMENLGILSFSNNSYNYYWLASRYNYKYKNSGDTYYSRTYFLIRVVGSSGNLASDSMFYFDIDLPNAQLYTRTEGLRPVIRLKAGVVITSGSGTEDDPYILSLGVS